MKKMNRRLTVLLLALLMLVMLPMQAFARDRLDPEQPVKLTIRYFYEEQPIKGAEFALYRVASVDVTGSFTLVEPYTAYPVSLSGLTETDWDALPEVFKGNIQKDKPAADATIVTGQEGVGSAEALEAGLYFVLASNTSQGGYSYSAKPALVCLPGLGENDLWTYDVLMQPKVERTALPSGDDTVSRKVIKIWDDNDSAERPESVTVELLRDGEVYDTVTLNADNNWRYTWSKLRKTSKTGKVSDWSVAEQPVEGYTVSIAYDTGVFSVTNTAQEKPAPVVDTALPQTGLLWWPVPVLVCAGLLCLLIAAARRRKQKAE